MQQGYPISEEMPERSDTDGKTYTVQYFERAVFEKHPKNAPPNDVLLSLLGVFLYQQKYPSGRPSGLIGQALPGSCVATHDDSDVDSGRGFTPGAPEQQVVGKGLVLTGRVLSSLDCAPIAGAKLEMRPEMNNDHPASQRATLYTNASGRYRFESDFPEHIHMRVSAHGFKTIITNLFHTTPGKSVDSFDVVLVPDPSCRWFAETGQALCGIFLDYWLKNGGLAQQGYPISDEFQERSDLNGKTYRVQYFQRAVFEHHPENTPPYNVLLSQLGTFRFKAKHGGGSVPTPITPPTLPNFTATPAPSAIASDTPLPPTETETNAPRPTRTPISTWTPTPIPTVCPTLQLGLSCRTDGSVTVIVATWDVVGGGGEINGELITEVDGSVVSRRQVSGRSGFRGYTLPCDYNGPPVHVDFTLTMSDECGQSASASCGGTIINQPCR
jgi:hypothetical protein